MYPLAQSAGLAMVALTMATAAQAQTVVRDSETGAVRAPEATSKAGKSAAAAPRIGLITGKVDPQPIVHADGTVEQELDASTLSYTVVRRNADGSITMECATGEDAAYQGLAANSRSTARVKKEHRHDVK